MKIKNKNTFIHILYLSIVISFATSILFLSSSYGLSFAQKDDNDENEDDEVIFSDSFTSL
jgi:Na+-transporting NADH:ubiquinone oxidoreductase subunit NqrC